MEPPRWSFYLRGIVQKFPHMKFSSWLRTVIIASATSVIIFVAYITLWTCPVIDLRQVVVSKYLVDSPTCRIPDLNPWDPSISFLMKWDPPVVCSKDPLLSYSKGGTLYFNKSAVTSYGGGKNEGDVQCCYETIHRVEQDPNHYDNKADSVIRYSDKCISFDSPVTMVGESNEFIRVTCQTRGRPVYTNFHAFVTNKRKVQEKLRAKRPFKVSPKHRPLSILLWGIDSISRLHKIRALPRTAKLFESLGAIELLGYNKVEDNTFPNLVPVFSGLDYNEIRNICWSDYAKKLDDCPFLWRNFSDRGYVTFFMEDAPELMTFNYLRTGFVIPPTDYYFRPYMMASDYYWPRTTYLHMCQGPTNNAHVLYDYSRQFFHKFRNSSYFAIAWHNSLGHDHLSPVAQSDADYFNFFSDLFKSGAFENTAIVLFSDHGMRFGPIRKTYVGWLEERLPFIYIYLPPSFHLAHPQAVRHLRENARRLTTPFDLHEMLSDLVTLNFSTSAVDPKSRGISLFRTIPLNRTCADAAIPPEYCTCQSSKPASVTDPDVLMAANATISWINNMVKPHHECAVLELEQVLSAREYVAESGRSLQSIEVSDYTIMLRTSPGNGHFESQVRHWLDTNEFLVMGHVSRINRYGRQSDCIKDAKLRLYCACLNLRFNYSSTV